MGFQDVLLWAVQFGDYCKENYQYLMPNIIYIRWRY